MFPVIGDNKTEQNCEPQMVLLALIEEERNFYDIDDRLKYISQYLEVNILSC
jgi:hypothetical protein